MKGYVFNIQEYSIHDGPGIRTIIFLKGCPLSCKWCANPESQLPLPQVAFKEDKCLGGQCLYCQSVCANRVIFYPGAGPVQMHFDKCLHCMKCADICPSKAIITYGKYREVEDVLDEAERDAMFYNRTNGGITLSGGEPMAQPEFALALLKGAKERAMSTAIETTCFTKWETARDIIDACDYVMMDVKCMDSDKHKKFTGVPNELILENLKKLREEFPHKPLKVRTPIIPGFNNTAEDVAAIRDLVKSLPGDPVEYEILKYHKFGEQKYTFLGKTYPLGDVELTDEEFEALKLVAYAE